MTHDEDISKKKDNRVLDYGQTKVALMGILEAYDRLIDDYRDLEWDYHVSERNVRKVTSAYMNLLSSSNKNKSIDV
jgi:hypothetical protein